MSFRALLPLISLIAGIAYCLFLNYSVSLGLAFAIVVTLFSVKSQGYSYRQQFQYGWDGVKQTKPVLIILFLVGLLVPLLMMGGVIPAIIYYGLQFVKVEFLLTIGFLLASGVSYLLGTSVGTLSTVGLSLIGIAHAAQVPLGMMAGALISGAMVGERFSPISSSRLLVLSSINRDQIRSHFSHTTGLLAVGITTLIFLGLDLSLENHSATDTIWAFQNLLEQHFTVSLLSLLPILVLFGSFVFRVKAIPALLYGVIASALLVFCTTEFHWNVFGKAMLYGLDLQSGTQLDALVHGGGMLAILKVLLLISLAGFMNGILDKANLLKPIVDRMMGKTENVQSLVFKTVLLSLFVVVISCNQTIPILVIAATLQSRFATLKDENQLFERTMLDATLVMPVLVPWNGLAMMMSVTLGVPTVESLPYLWFSLLLPVVTIFFARFYQPRTKNRRNHIKKEL